MRCDSLDYFYKKQRNNCIKLFYSIKNTLLPTLVLISLSLLFLYCAMSTPAFYKKFSGLAYNPTQTPSIIFFIGFTILCFFILPIIVNHFFFKEHLQDLGLAFPKNKIKAGFLITFAFLLLIPCTLFMSHNKISQTYYGLHDISLIKSILILFVALPLYYFTEEFFFRGFLFMLLWKKVKWHSFWITDIIFILAHIGKPPLEILLAIPAGIIFGYLALRTRSIFPSMLVHYTMGAILIILINVNSG